MASSSSSSSCAVHKVALAGFASGTNDHYDKSRPSYPLEAVQHIHDAVSSVQGGLNVVELGAGTGIFSRLLLAPPEGFPTFDFKSFIATDPSEGMRDTFMKTLPKDIKVPVKCVEATFTSFPKDIEDGSVDLIVIAQAFHWSHPDYDSSIKTISRALKPATGVLCLLWNLEDESRPSHPWVGPFRARYQQHEASSPQYRLNLWHAAFSTPAYTSDFADRESTFFRSERETSVQTAVDRVLSKSYTTVLPEGEKDQLKSELRALLEADGSGVQWVDRDARTFLYPYATEVVICRKK